MESISEIFFAAYFFSVLNYILWLLSNLSRYDPRYSEPPSPRYQDRQRYSDSPRYTDNKYQNGDEHGLHHSNSFTISQQHHQQQRDSHYGTSHSTPSASPQHRNIHRYIITVPSNFRIYTFRKCLLKSRDSKKRNSTINSMK